MWQVLQLLPQSLSTQPSETQGAAEGLHLPVSTYNQCLVIVRSYPPELLTADNRFYQQCWLFNSEDNNSLNPTLGLLFSFEELIIHLQVNCRYASNREPNQLVFNCTIAGTAQLSVSHSLKECCWISIFSWCMEPKTQRGRMSTLIIWRLHLTRKRYCGT